MEAQMRKKAYYLPVFVAVVAVAMLAFGVTAWAKTYTFQATSITPGATGTVDVKADKSGGNTNVAITVDHLARPTLLTPAANEYVVWIEPEDGVPQNQGVLRVGDNEKGALRMTTTSSKFKVMVTAETETHPQAPSNRVVLRADVQE
jgi:hypothetical protein